MTTKVIHSYEVTISVPFPEEHKTPARRAINDAHGYAWAPDNDVPKPVQDAHWLLNAGQQQTVTVDVYSDGTRRIRLP
jgi:hypothetical protein